MPVKVASLGLFILDTFQWNTLSGETIKKEDTVVGGGGTYAIIGARMWLPADEIGIVIDRGNDWLKEIQDELDEFGPMWHYRDNPNRPTTRALNLYTGEKRDFKYLNERTRLEPRDVPDLIRSCKYLHCVCSPTRAKVIHQQLLLPQNRTPLWKPELVFEPIPDRCCPEELESLKEVLPSIGIFSPNHEEAWAFFGVSVEDVAAKGFAGIEEVTERFFEMGYKGTVVIRSGAMGAYAKRHGEEGFWIPAYHSEVSKVVDVTGAGNSFMGGLMAGMAENDQDLKMAVMKGTVSASFTIEQFGLPKLTQVDEENWNNESPEQRLLILSNKL